MEIFDLDFDLLPMTLGKNKIAGGVEYLYKLFIQSVGPCWRSSQRWRRAAAAHEGDDNKTSGPTGRGVKTTKVVLSDVRGKMDLLHPHIK